jgi:aminoglycoside phosphotransferase (APT) family kinase protein
VSAGPGSDRIDAIFTEYRIAGAWERLPSTGVANWIYATRDVVLRVATDHPDGVPDARTESVAAPAAYAAGILTPQMIAFDDTRSIVDRPFSLWERIHGKALGQATLSRQASQVAWRAVGRELARVHRLVTVCDDPHGYLDTPGDEPDPDRVLATLVAEERLDAKTARDIAVACRELGETAPAGDVVFTHGDVHRMNVMCGDDGKLLALIDWGDACWNDPMHDFASMPLDAIPVAVAGYEAEAGTPLDPGSRARLIRDKVVSALDHFVRHPERELDADAVRRFARSARSTMRSSRRPSAGSSR